MDPAAPDWAAIRAEFPALSRWTYLNTATFGQVPRRAIQAIARHFERRDELACSDFLSWFDDADRIRGKVAHLINATRGDIAFVPNVATALGLLLSGIQWQPGDRIVTLELEFPDLIYHPALLAACGVEFVETSWARFPHALTRNTRLVAVSEVNYITGFRAPLAEIAPELRQRGILLFIDGTQSAGALRFDAAAIQPSIYAVHGYKWLLAPDGAGFMYVHPELRERLAPNVIGWRSHRDWRWVDNLHHGAPVFTGEAEKYEGGMIPFAVLYAMEAFLDLILELGDRAHRRARAGAGGSGARRASRGRRQAAFGRIAALRFARGGRAFPRPQRFRTGAGPGPQPRAGLGAARFSARFAALLLQPRGRSALCGRAAPAALRTAQSRNSVR
ncbi:MAG: aminotransferase class V-fold PLP-dependent enzyme [Bryobacteraceae bacterium]